MPITGLWLATLLTVFLRFNSSISRTWDVTSIHINKPDLAGAKEDVEYYVSTYGKVRQYRPP